MSCREGGITWCVRAIVISFVLSGQLMGEQRIYSLYDIVEMAVTRNPRLKEMWQVASAAQYNWKGEESSYYPEIRLTHLTAYDAKEGTTFGVREEAAADGTIETKGGVVLRTRQLFTQFTGTYLLLDCGERAGNTGAARESFIAANSDAQQLLQDTILAALHGYYLYVATIADEEASLQNLKDAESSYEAAQVRFAAGVSQKLDLLQLRAQCAVAERSLIEARGNSAVALARLAHVIGQPPHRHFDVVLPPDELWSSPALPDVAEMISLALAERRDMAAARANNMADRHRWKAARAAGLPKLSLDAFWNNQLYFKRPSFTHGRNGNVTLTLEIPLYKGGFYSAQANSARAQMQASHFHCADVLSGLSLDVVTTYNQFQTAVSALSSSRDYLAYSQEAVSAALVGYRSGTVSLLDLLAAQKGVADARAQWVEARSNWLYSLANAAHATGTLNTASKVLP